MKPSVWKRIDRAARDGKGITLSPDDLSEMMQHGSVYDEVEEQIHLEDERKTLKRDLER